MTLFIRRLVHLLVAIAALAALVQACGIDFTFRAYLASNFWQPTRRYVDDLTKGLPRERRNDSAYAGLASGGSPAMLKLRSAYRSLLGSARGEFVSGGYASLLFSKENIAAARTALASTAPGSSAEGHEWDLVRCKIDLREATVGDDATLGKVQACFQSYLERTRPAPLRSEARGWLARTYFLRKNSVSAAKIYLDELESPTTNIRRETLLTSLSMLYRDEGRVKRLGRELNEYFDTPTHALFVSNVVTSLNLANPSSEGILDVASSLVGQLEQHADMFQKGARSDALALALMRAAIRIGDGEAALRYAERLPKDSDVRKNPEYAWLVGTAGVLKGDYAAAEPSFLEVLAAKDADSRQRIIAATALVGVYQKLHRPADALWAAFRASSIDYSDLDSDLTYQEVLDTGLAGSNLDVAYLLDVQLTDEELRQYLDRHPVSSDTTIATAYPRPRTGSEMVLYELAVRHARREEYDEAARIYKDLQAWPRAQLMREAARIFRETRNTDLPEDRHLQALYDYAAFLGDNSTRVFFNDGVWHSIQNAVLSPAEYQNIPALAPDERARLEPLQRKLKDDQEEYWRAYQILNGVVEKAGPTPLGRRAASRAIVLLRRIREDRFGREKEVHAADTRLTNWLAQANRRP